MNDYIQFVDAQEDLLIEQSADAIINEQGKLAMQQFQAWYGLEEFEDLDEEYKAVKALINFNEETEEKLCPDGTK